MFMQSCLRPKCTFMPKYKDKSRWNRGTGSGRTIIVGANEAVLQKLYRSTVCEIRFRNATRPTRTHLIRTCDQQCWPFTHSHTNLCVVLYTTIGSYVSFLFYVPCSVPLQRVKYFKKIQCLLDRCLLYGNGSLQC